MASGAPLDAVQLRPSGDLEWWERQDIWFRVLVLGRANAGKTTILERLANASENKAMIFKFRDGRRSEAVCSRIII
jgi:polynucleotide 5'-kinase involved in rRNA processing